jgi:nucleotidyltransferase substrate binding protein (TIGR01987 family)
MGSHLVTKRAISSYNNFEKALLTLQKAVYEVNKENEYLEAATVQMFEYTYEAAWKAIKFILEGNGVYLLYPAQAFMEAFSAGWLLDAEKGKNMVLARNSTSHNYSEEKAGKIYSDICNIYYPELKYLQLQLKGVIDNGNT